MKTKPHCTACDCYEIEWNEMECKHPRGPGMLFSQETPNTCPLNIVASFDYDNSKTLKFVRPGVVILAGKFGDLQDIKW